jgi:hypothetical protein
MTCATARGWDRNTAWLALISVTCALARWYIERSKSGLIIRSWVETIANVGFAFHAGCWVIAVPKALENGHLRQRKELAFRLRQVAGKIGGVDGRIQEQEPVLGRRDPRRSGRRLLQQTAKNLPRIGGKRGNINQCRYFRIVSRLGDDGAAVAVGNQDHRCLLSIEDAAGRGDVVLERGHRLLDNGNLVTVLDEDVGDRFPTRAIGKSAMDEDYGLRGRRDGGRTRQRGERSSGGQQGTEFGHVVFPLSRQRFLRIESATVG